MDRNIHIFCTFYKYKENSELEKIISNSLFFLDCFSQLLFQQPPFRVCTSLKNITIYDGITTINQLTFANCSSLQNVTIPNTVTTIQGAAFAECTALDNFTIPNTVTTIGTNAFLNVPHIYYTGTATDSPWGALAIN